MALLDNEEAKAVLPWEPVGQCKASELPEAAPEDYPAPWTTRDRGNGHVDVFAANDKQVAHVFLWDASDWETFKTKLADINGN